MNLRNVFWILISLMSSTIYASGVLFPNFREGKISAYEYTVDQELYDNLAVEISAEQSLNWQQEYTMALTEDNGYCVEKHLNFLNQKLLMAPGKKLQKLLSYIKLLRDRALLDDYSYDYLFNVVNNNSDKNFPLVHFSSDSKERMASAGTIRKTTELKEILVMIQGLRKKLTDGSCKDEFYHKILNEGKNRGNITTSMRWRNFLSQLYRHHAIDKREFREILTLAKSKLFERNYTLNQYRNKLLLINKIFSITKEDSTTYFRDFRTPKNMSDRMLLYNNEKIIPYTFTKIKILIESLLERLSADEIGIFILNENNSKKDYRFSTLQQQRYALWMLNHGILTQEFNISTKNRGINMQMVFAVGYEIGLFTGRDMEGVSVLRNILEPKVDNGIQWEEILQESFTAGIFLFPEKRTLLLLTSILVELFFPSDDQEKELHVF